MDIEFIGFVILTGFLFGYHFGLRPWVEIVVSNYMLKKHFYGMVLVLYLFLLLIFAPYYFKVAIICLPASEIGGAIGTLLYETYQKNADIANMEAYFNNINHNR